MKKTQEELQKEYDKTAAELKRYQRQSQRLENRIRYYTEGDRKKRNHRLITRGAAVESLVPQVRGLSEREFYLLAEQIFSLPEAAALVRRAVNKTENP